MRNLIINGLLCICAIILSYLYFQFGNFIVISFEWATKDINLLSFAFIVFFPILALPAILIILKKIKNLIK